ncbi:MAG TPA: DUF1499 domain-containing protein [Balneolaceae bacterium]|nr:DUF1499 domain-containing protein [Balneolaceae bacterium]
MNPILKYGLIAVVVIAAILFFSRFQGSRSSDFNEMMQSNDNPLPDCPDSPNCVRISVPFAQPTSRIFFLATQAVEDLQPVEFSSSQSDLTATAVFEIPVFGFRDDLQMKIEGEDRNHVLHIRSASRTGYSDLGVNRRRVRTIIKSIREKL